MTVENRSLILQGDWGIGRLCGGRLRFRLPCDRAVRARLLLMPSWEHQGSDLMITARIRVNTWHAVNLRLFMFRVLDLVSGNVKLRELSSQSRGNIHSTLVTLLILNLTIELYAMVNHVITEQQRPVSHIPLARRVDEFGSDLYGNATTSLQYCDVFQ